MTTLPYPLVLLTAASCLLFTGCPGDDSGDDASDPTTSTTTSTTTATSTSTSTEDSTGISGSTTDGGDSTDGGSTTDASGVTDTTTGDGDSTGSSGEMGLEIAGDWFEDFGGGSGVDHIITDVQWDQLSDFGDATFHIESYDNGAGWAVAQGDAANEFFPGLYSKFNWAWDGADLYYCTAVFDAATAADAMAAPDADAGDLAMGCFGFPWSLLAPA